MINEKRLIDLNPCQERLDNYLKYYKDQNFTPSEFLALQHISHKDKVWVAAKIISYKKLPLLIADIAESVLHLFENKYPEDKRPRLAIEAARGNNTNAAYTVGYAAGFAADLAYAGYAAYDTDANAAAYAAAYAAYAAANADNADNAAYYITRADNYTTTANAISKRKNQEQVNLDIILKYWNQE